MNEKKRAFNEYEMLKGNINRMFVTDTKEELVSMYFYSKTRLEKIYEFNLQRIKEKG
ncbi:hypothetical protein [Robinsoniella peoriensis]|uniref:hypothetical protein n=1 Tax=Robinsoniella peoriensis TaxID=180332 RepID=UPI00362A725C